MKNISFLKISRSIFEAGKIVKAGHGAHKVPSASKPLLAVLRP